MCGKYLSRIHIFVSDSEESPLKVCLVVVYVESVCVDESECDNDSSIEAAGRDIVEAVTILDCSGEVTPAPSNLRGRNLIADREPDILLLINLCAIYVQCMMDCGELEF